MVEVTKQDRENANSLIRRFSRTMKESGILREVRAKRFFRESKSKHYKKESQEEDINMFKQPMMNTW